MPSKNTDNDLNKELYYCRELEKRIENEPSVCEIPAVKEKLNLLKETMEVLMNSWFFLKIVMPKQDTNPLTAPFSDTKPISP